MMHNSLTVFKIGDKVKYIGPDELLGSHTIVNNEATIVDKQIANIWGFHYIIEYECIDIGLHRSKVYGAFLEKIS